MKRIEGSNAREKMEFVMNMNLTLILQFTMFPAYIQCCWLTYTVTVQLTANLHYI